MERLFVACVLALVALLRLVNGKLILFLVFLCLVWLQAPSEILICSAPSEVLLPFAPSKVLACLVALSLLGVALLCVCFP